MLKIAGKGRGRLFEIDNALLILSILLMGETDDGQSTGINQRAG